MDLYDFNGVEESYRRYGGQSGLKKGIYLDGEYWLLKFPKNTLEMRNVNVSYTTSPLSEYLGSHIYEILGYDVHQTELGFFNQKMVVACKDFLSDDELLFDFSQIKNTYNSATEELLTDHSSESGSDTDFESVLAVTKANEIEISGLEERFWNMLVVDAFINNNDRNNGNWGYVYNRNTKEQYLAPIFDNGAAFYNKKSIAEFARYLKDDRLLHDNAIPSVISCYKMNGDKIHPFAFFKQNYQTYPMLAKALVENGEKISEKQGKIKEFLNEIPSEVSFDNKVYQIFNPIYKEYISTILDIRAEKIIEISKEVENFYGIKKYILERNEEIELD